jgi:uncharacterized membrane protein YgcG
MHVPVRRRSQTSRLAATSLCWCHPSGKSKDRERSKSKDKDKKKRKKSKDKKDKKKVRADATAVPVMLTWRQPLRRCSARGVGGVEQGGRRFVRGLRMVVYNWICGFLTIAGRAAIDWVCTCFPPSLQSKSKSSKRKRRRGSDSGSGSDSSSSSDSSDSDSGGGHGEERQRGAKAAKTDDGPIKLSEYLRS